MAIPTQKDKDPRYAPYAGGGGLAAGSGSFSGALVTNSGAQTLTTAEFNALTFDTESFDTDSYYSSGSPTKLTVTTAGKYLITGAVDFTSNATGQRSIAIRLNGTTYVSWQWVQAANGNRTALSIAAIVSAAANDYYELIGTQNSGGDLATEVDFILTSFAITKL